VRCSQALMFLYCDTIDFREIDSVISDVADAEERNPFRNVAPDTMQAVLNDGEHVPNYSKRILAKSECPQVAIVL
jgi:hypothetical protein